MSYYLTKSNPYRYRLQDALYYYRSASDISWTTCKDAEPGDILFIGQSGNVAGIYAKAIVASTPIFEESGHPFWVNPGEARKLAWMALLESLHLIDSPILEHIIRRGPELKRVADWLHIQGAVCHLTEDEGRAIDRLVMASP